MRTYASAIYLQRMTEFTSLWALHHPTGPPIAHLLRQVERETWVRFHSLPMSKRYAESMVEKRVVLDRANKLATRVLGAGSRCWLVHSEPDHGEAVNDIDAYGTINQYRLEFQFDHAAIEDECVYQVFAAPVVWTAGAFDNLISKVADDELPRPIMLVSAKTGAAFAPYDGGSDLFVPTQADVDALKHEYSRWLSAHSSGL